MAPMMPDDPTRAAVKLTPTYLKCTSGGSDKWYVAVIVDADRGKGLTGYGPNKPNAGGTFNVYDPAKVRKKLDEKRREYDPARYDDLPTPARDNLLHHVSQMLPNLGPPFFLSDGGIRFRHEDQPAPIAPKRRKPKAAIWI